MNKMDMTMRPLRPLRWWSPAQLAQLAERIEQRLTRWCEAWGLPALEQGGIVCQLAQEQTCHTFEYGTGWVPLFEHAAVEEQAWLQTEQAPERAIFDAMFGGQTRPAARPDDNTVAVEVVEAVCEDWLREIRELLQPMQPLQPDATISAQSAPVAASPPALHALPWSGAVRIDIVGFAVKAILHLGPERAASLMRVSPQKTPDKKYATAPLVSLRQALDDQPVRARVELASVELDLGSLLSLTEGDVIRLPHLLDQPLVVYADDASVLCAGYLGQVNGLRAIELTRAL